MTFFRVAQWIDAERSPTHLPLLVQAFFFHGAWSDIGSQFFLYDEAQGQDVRRNADGATSKLNVHVRSHELVDEGNGSWRATFDVQGVQFDLELKPEREPVLHGKDPGLAVKGTQPGEASYYYSVTRLRTTGTLRESGSSRAEQVEGSSWFDHEFGTTQIGEGTTGWDWFSVALSDGNDLMLYALRRKDGTMQPASSGTILHPDGRAEFLTQDQFSLEVTSSWTSPHTAAQYPAAWRVRIPSHELDLVVQPLVADQELQTPRTTRVTYWEGATKWRGTHRGIPVEGTGYVELAGYAHTMAGLF